MARGYPAVVSGVIGGSIAAAGVGVRRETAVADQLGIVLIAFGAVIVATGLVVQLRAPGKPTNKINIEEASKYNPTQRVALARITFGLAATFAGGYGLFYTQLPYAYPGILTLAGAVFLGIGLQRYWANSLMTYYVDADSGKVFRGYRLFARKSANPEATQFVDINIYVSPIEQVLGVGDVIVELDGNNSVHFRDIDSFQQFDNEVESLREETESTKTN